MWGTRGAKGSLVVGASHLQHRGDENQVSGDVSPRQVDQPALPGRLRSRLAGPGWSEELLVTRAELRERTQRREWLLQC